jgi:carboxylesterase
MMKKRVGSVTMVQPPGTDRHKPYLYETAGSQTAILMVHGVFGSPVQFVSIAQALFEQGFTVMAILLPGHGGSAKAFSQANVKHWQQAVREAAMTLRQRYRHIFLIGHSMGGLLVINEALERRADGVILISVPMRMKIGLGNMKMCLRVLWGNPDKDDNSLKSYRLAFSVEKGSLGRYVLWALQMPRLLGLISQTRRSISKAQFPVLIIQSRQDETVSWKSVKVFERYMQAAPVETMLLEKSGHGYHHPDEAPDIHERICRFVKRHRA